MAAVRLFVQSRNNRRDKVRSEPNTHSVNGYLPLLVQRSRHKLGEGPGLNLFAFLQAVIVRLEFHQSIESLHISTETRDTHQHSFVDFEDALEVAVDSHQLCGETRICSNRHAILAGHRDHAVAVVLINTLLSVKFG